MIFEMLTGRRAFEGQTQASLVAAILKEQPPPVSALHAGAPDALDHIVSACLVKDREARWQSARDLEIELRWLADGSARLREAQALPAGRARERFWVAAVLMLIVIAGLLTVRQFYRAAAPARTIRSLLSAPENSNFVSVGLGAGPAVFSPMVAPSRSSLRLPTAGGCSGSGAWTRSRRSSSVAPMGRPIHSGLQTARSSASFRIRN